MLINKIKPTSQFKRSFRKLPPQIQKHVIKKKNLFAKNPFLKSLETHKLGGKLKNRWSFSVTYSYRIIFDFVDKNEAIFYDVGDHEIYQ